MAISSLTLRLAAELRAVVTEQTDDATRQLVSAWVRAWDEIAASFQHAIFDVVNHDGPLTLTQAAKLDRVEAALQHAAAQLDRLIGHSSQVATLAARDILRAGADLTPKIMASQLPQSIGSLDSLAARFGRLNADALDALIERTTEQVTSLALPLSDSATGSMLEALTRAIPEGESPRTTAQLMLQGTEDAFNGGLSRALTISRTEVLDVYRSASNGIYAENSDVLQGWMWSAELDDGVCISCVVMDGAVFPIEDPGPNDHQNGRCESIPVTASWEDLGLAGMEEPESLYPDAQAWFDGLPEETKLEIAGPGRLEAYQSGKADWPDLSTTRAAEGWRDSRVPTAVADLFDE